MGPEWPLAKPPQPESVSIANVCRSFTCTVPEAIEMLSPKYVKTTRAVIDAMILQEGAPKVREWQQANAKAAEKGDAPIPLEKALGDDVSGAKLIIEAYRLGQTASDDEQAELERRGVVPGRRS